MADIGLGAKYSNGKWSSTVSSSSVPTTVDMNVKPSNFMPTDNIEDMPADYWEKQDPNYPNWSDKLTSSSEVPADASDPDYSAFKSAWNWLSSVISNVPLHMTNIALGGLLYGTNSVTGVRRGSESGLGKALDYVVAGIGTAAAWLESVFSGEKIGFNLPFDVVDTMNALLDEFKNPNIEGIPIHADVEQESQDITIAKNLYIQNSKENKTYAIDNTVPQLKTWKISGYLVSNPNLQPGISNLLIKPDLISQRKLLQLYIDTRKPVMFKTHDNRFYYVLITHFDSAYTTQGLNALQVNLTLTEYRVMKVGSTTMQMQVAGTTIPNILKKG